MFLQSCCKLSAQVVTFVGISYIRQLCAQHQIKLITTQQAEMYLEGAHSSLKALQSHILLFISINSTSEAYAAVSNRNVAMGSVPRMPLPGLPTSAVSKTVMENTGAAQEQSRHATSTATNLSLPTSRNIQINRITFDILGLTAGNRLKQIEETCNVTIKLSSISNGSAVNLAVEGKSLDCCLEEGIERLTEECRKIVGQVSEAKVEISHSVVPILKKFNWASLKTFLTVGDAYCTLVGLQEDVEVARKLVMQVVRSQSALNGPNQSINDSVFVAEGGQVVIVKKGNITKEHVDVIVNAANSKLEHTGGVARAICEAAGGETFQKHCSTLREAHGPIQEGDAVVTGAGSLNQKMIVHAVAPKWCSQEHQQKNVFTLLCQLCYKCLKLTDENGAMSVAIPGIGSGKFGIPKQVCAEALVASTENFFRDNPVSCIKCVIFMDMDDAAVGAFTSQAQRYFGGRRTEHIQDMLVDRSLVESEV